MTQDRTQQDDAKQITKTQIFTTSAFLFQPIIRSVQTNAECDELLRKSKIMSNTDPKPAKIAHVKMPYGDIECFTNCAIASILACPPALGKSSEIASML